MLQKSMPNLQNFPKRKLWIHTVFATSHISVVGGVNFLHACKYKQITIRNRINKMKPCTFVSKILSQLKSINTCHVYLIVSINRLYSDFSTHLERLIRFSDVINKIKISTFLKLRKRKKTKKKKHWCYSQVTSDLLCANLQRVHLWTIYRRTKCNIYNKLVILTRWRRRRRSLVDGTTLLESLPLPWHQINHQMFFFSKITLREECHIFNWRSFISDVQK